jgi:1,2-dihydroxy-3-keto-5-methylthiopentene dioxygenase
MSRLTIHDERDGAILEEFRDGEDINRELARIGVRFERWRADRLLAPDADQEAVLAAYREPVQRLMEEYGFQSVDVVSLDPDHPERETLRNKFLSEHTHGDFEVRFFVAGSGLFYLHVDDKVYLVLCEQGDLISVPANTTHWFDMGSAPCFKCIRLFTTPEGWVANFTGSDIASRFPSMDSYCGKQV